MNDIRIKNFKEIPYEELEELNLAAKAKMISRENADKIQEQYLKHLVDERHLKAITVGFSDIEGRFHMLDYDKKFLVKCHDNLTFDGSSIRGFSSQQESDLRLAIDWPSLRWLPSDVFGPGKVIVFGLIKDKDGSPFDSDFRGVLADYTGRLHRERSLRANVAVELEGFLFKGQYAEQNYDPAVGFELVTLGGYFHSLPTSPLKVFIDRLAEAQRALGFENEKDHPEVAPSQFELNYSYCDALVAADQVQLYKLLARQIADNMGLTASFLPKPRTAINGSGMHTNISLARDGANIFHDADGQEKLSDAAWDFIDRTLESAGEICLTMNPSVNSYRRLDPHYEAPNQIRVSAVDRSAMVRIPIGNKNSSRIEVRSVGPDANPYLAFQVLLKTGLEGPLGPNPKALRKATDRTLPSSIQEAIELFRGSAFMKDVLGESVHGRFAELKTAVADRCPKSLGTRIKQEEIVFHHEVTNQFLWSCF